MSQISTIACRLIHNKTSYFVEMSMLTGLKFDRK
jgi:hypothetical protein